MYLLKLSKLVGCSSCTGRNRDAFTNIFNGSFMTTLGNEVEKRYWYWAFSVLISVLSVSSLSFFRFRLTVRVNMTAQRSSYSFHLEGFSWMERTFWHKGQTKTRYISMPPKSCSLGSTVASPSLDRNTSKRAASRLVFWAHSGKLIWNLHREAEAVLRSLTA